MTDDQHAPPAPVWKQILTIAGNFLAGSWIILGTTFFLIRFSFLFYRANQAPIDEILARLGVGG